MTPPSQTPSDPVHDLHPDLLHIGWRKFWSKREGRPYFFNKVTNESLWETPRLPGTSSGYDPITDPLGIQSAGHPPTPEPTTPGHAAHGYVPHWPARIGGEKRPSDEAGGNLPNKKLALR